MYHFWFTIVTCTHLEIPVCSWTDDNGGKCICIRRIDATRCRLRHVKVKIIRLIWMFPTHQDFRTVITDNHRGPTWKFLQYQRCAWECRTDAIRPHSPDWLTIWLCLKTRIMPQKILKGCRVNLMQIFGASKGASHLKKWLSAFTPIYKEHM